MGFETIVRPAVIPNIRPQTPRVLPPASDPTQGVAVIRGNSASVASGSRNYSISMSQSMHREIQRVSTRKRVYQKTGGSVAGSRGVINKENYVDIDYAKEITHEGGASPSAQAGTGSGSTGVGSGTPAPTEKPPSVGSEEFGSQTAGAPPPTSAPTSRQRDTRQYEIPKDGDNIETIKENIVLSPEKQTQPLAAGNWEGINPADAESRIKAARTHFENIAKSFAVKGTFKLKPMHGEFTTEYELTTTDLKIPTGYDLEAGDVTSTSA